MGHAMIAGPDQQRPTSRGDAPWQRVPRRGRATRAALGSVSVCLGAALFAPAGGCSAPPKPFFESATERLVWPSPPDEPRVRYLGQFAGEITVPRSNRLRGAWNELLYGPDDPPRLITPHAVAVDATSRWLAIADTNAKCVHLLELQRPAYLRIEGSATAGALLECPVAVAWRGEQLVVADATAHAVLVVAGLSTAGGTTAGPSAVRVIGRGALQRPAGVACHPTNGLIYVSDAAMHAVLAFDESGSVVRTFGARGTGPGEFNRPGQLAFAPDGSLVIADVMSFRIQRFTPEGVFLGGFGAKGDAAGDFALPKGVAVDAEGNVWVADAQFENVQAFAPDGRLLLAFGGEGRGAGEFWLPAGMTIDGQRRLWVADSYNRRVQAFELLRGR
ncbi:MAG: hypothetical protein HY763_04660 [Planctomycetes bacterium]|nr:hypothetical protein [Planctomycetota bacterium]